MRTSWLLATASALTLVTGASFAADLPSRQAPPPAPVVYAPVFTWTGFYVGLNAGMGWSNSGNVEVYSPLLLAPTVFNVGSSSGFVGGGQAGYNVQFGQFVIGAEADIQYADLGSRDINWGVYRFVNVPRGGGNQYFGTVRARAGYAFDRALIYVTGGLAYGGWGGNNVVGSSSSAGWTLGGGVEYAFTNNWTAKLEGLYVNLNSGTKNVTVTDIFGVPYNVYAKNGNGGGVVRVGINYKF